MKVDEKGLDGWIKEQAASILALYRFDSQDDLRRAGEAFAILGERARALSARSAEPVASEIGEEEIARALVEFQFPGCGEDEATVASHLPMARAVLALLQPALERARVEERKRCLAIVNAQTPDWVKERSGPFWDGYREAMEDASNDISKGSGE